MDSSQENLLPLTGFLNRVLIFDDDITDASNLSEVLSSSEIACECFTPEELEGTIFHKNRQLLFCDLHMWGDSFSDIQSVSSKLRKLLENTIAEDFGAYGLVVWTEHEEDAEELILRLSRDREGHRYNTPIFVLSLSKLKYKELGYSSLVGDLTEKLQKSISASFYVSWGNIAKEGFNNAITSLYSRINDFSKQDEVMLPLLSAMALNYTGIPDEEIQDYHHFSEDTFHAMNDMLCTDLYNSKLPVFDLYCGLFSKPNFQSLEDELSLYSFLNANLFAIPSFKLEPNHIMPGNVYEIKTGKDIYGVGENRPKNSRDIMIELTPPCDYAHRKIASRFVSGFMFECPTDNDAIYNVLESKCRYGYRYSIWPIEFDAKPYIICFDFRYLFKIDDEEIMNGAQYELLFRFPNHLFADILQKFSSHAARLGENIFRPNIKEPLYKDCMDKERSLVDKVSEKLKDGPIPANTFKQMAKSRGFKINEDREYLKLLLARKGMKIEDNGVVTMV